MSFRVLVGMSLMLGLGACVPDPEGDETDGGVMGAQSRDGYCAGDPCGCGGPNGPCCVGGPHCNAGLECSADWSSGVGRCQPIIADADTDAPPSDADLDAGPCPSGPGVDAGPEGCCGSVGEACCGDSMMCASGLVCVALGASLLCVPADGGG